MKIGKWTSREWDYYYDEPGDYVEVKYGIQMGSFFFGLVWLKFDILECTIADDDTVDYKTNRARRKELQKLRKEHHITGRWSVANSEQADARFDRTPKVPPMKTMGELD